MLTGRRHLTQVISMCVTWLLTGI